MSKPISPCPVRHSRPAPPSGPLSHLSVCLSVCLPPPPSECVCLAVCICLLGAGHSFWCINCVEQGRAQRSMHL